MIRLSESTPPRWRRVSNEQAIWSERDGEFAVYHRPSGKTHFLNAASNHLINVILEEPRTVGDVARAMFGLGASPEEDQKALQRAAASLLRLEQLGLIERV